MAERLAKRHGISLHRPVTPSFTLALSSEQSLVPRPTAPLSADDLGRSLGNGSAEVLLEMPYGERLDHVLAVASAEALLTMDSKPRLPALRAELENRAGHMERAGRDVFILGLLTALWVYFMHPDMPSGILWSLELFAALAPFVYLVALYAALRLRQKALRLSWRSLPISP